MFLPAAAVTVALIAEAEAVVDKLVVPFEPVPEMVGARCVAVSISKAVEDLEDAGRADVTVTGADEAIVRRLDKNEDDANQAVELAYTDVLQDTVVLWRILTVVVVSRTGAGVVTAKVEVFDLEEEIVEEDFKGDEGAAVEDFTSCEVNVEGCAVKEGTSGEEYTVEEEVVEHGTVVLSRMVSVTITSVDGSVVAALVALVVALTLLWLETLDLLLVLMTADEEDEEAGEEEEVDWTNAWPLTTGGAAEETSNPWMTSRALICCPGPDIASFDPVYHFVPQALASPTQILAAADADLVRYVVMVAFVKGAIWVVAHMNRARYALKENWSLLQVATPSHACSYMTLSDVKKLEEAFNKPSVRVCQVELEL